MASQVQTRAFRPCVGGSAGLGAAALRSAYLGATALQNPCKLSGMQNTLANHMRVFVAGDVSVQSLIYAAQAEQDDRDTARKVLMVLAGWDNSTVSSGVLRARVKNLI